jgi:hypothetical protein
MNKIIMDTNSEIIQKFFLKIIELKYGGRPNPPILKESNPSNPKLSVK